MAYIVGWSEPQGPERYVRQEVQEASSPKAAAFIEESRVTPWRQEVTVYETEAEAQDELDQIKANARLAWDMGYGRGKYQGD